MTIAIPIDATQPQPPLRAGTIRRILRYARPHTPALCALLGIIIVEGLLGIIPPLLFQRIVDQGVLAGNGALITTLSLLAIAVLILSSAATLGMRWLSAQIGQNLIFRLRADVFAHLQRLPIAFFTHNPGGALISRLSTDVTGAQGAISGVLPQVVSNLTGLAFVIGTMLYLSWPVALLALSLPPLLLLPARQMGRRMRRISHQRLEAVSDLTAFMTERLNVAGALLVRLYGHRDREHAAFTTYSARDRDLGVRIVLTGGIYSTVLMAVSSLSVVLVYWVGGHLALSGTLSVGTLIAFTALLARLYGPVTSLSTARVEVMTSIASFERIFEVLDEPVTVVEKPGAPPLPRDAADIEFDQVSFSYPPRRTLGTDPSASSSAPTPVLRHVSFRVRPGQKVAIVGPSGAGKSTIAGLVARLHDVDEGAVRIAGRDVREVSLESLRATVGVLTQDAHLFHDTIAANLRLAAPDATDEELIQACRAAQIWPLIESLPEGLQTVVGDRGYRLSGGEKQRLAIARLLLKAPTIVVLDEATAHLDTESEAAVQHALTHALRGRTMLVIAHRLSTVRDADLILVLDQGRIVERGTHEELLTAGGLYALLCRTQLATDEDLAPR